MSLPADRTVQLSDASRVIETDEADDALLARYRKGDREAFAELVVRYQRPLYNAALWIVRKPEDASDVTQIVFLRVAGSQRKPHIVRCVALRKGILAHDTDNDALDGPVGAQAADMSTYGGD